MGKFTDVTLGCDMTKATCDLITNTNETIVLDFVVGRYGILF